MCTTYKSCHSVPEHPTRFPALGSAIPTPICKCNSKPDLEPFTIYAAVTSYLGLSRGHGDMGKWGLN